jgi:DUF1009 family protein
VNPAGEPPRIAATATRSLAILCGAGAFPLEVAEETKRAGRDPFLVGIVGASDPAIENYPHLWVRLGEIGKLFAALKARDVGEIALIGAMARPEFSDLRLDWGAVKRAGELAKLFRGGDNTLLSGVARIFEREGLRIVGAHEIAPRLVAPLGRVGAAAAPADALADIRRAADLLDALAPFDVGQGAVVADDRVLAIEAAEGTDAMLARVGELRASGRLRLKGRAGVFVKAPKRGQDLRLDMPAIGPGTIEAAAKAELAGVALAAGKVLIAQREQVARAADAAGMFLVGFAA